MKEEITEDNCAFAKDDVDVFVADIAGAILENSVWDEKMVPIWQNLIIEKVMQYLV